MIRVLGLDDSGRGGLHRTPIHTLENYAEALPTAFGYIEAYLDSYTSAVPTAFGFGEFSFDGDLNMLGSPVLRSQEAYSHSLNNSFDWEGCCGDALGDLHYEEEFTNLGEITVEHNLGKRPSVTVTDSSGEELKAYVRHMDENTVFVDWKQTLSGKVVLN